MVQNQPEGLEALLLRARGHVEAEQALAADQIYKYIIEAVPHPKTGVERIVVGEASAWLARQALLRRRHGIAGEFYRAALAVDPYAIEYRLELIKRCLVPTGQTKEALVEAIKASNIEPENPDVWNVLGGVHHEIGNTQKAINAYKKQLELAPDEGQSHLDMATILLDTEDYEGVVRHAFQAAKTDRLADAYAVMAVAEYRQRNWAASLELFDKAIEAQAFNSAMLHWNKSHVLHALGRYKEGWIEHEYRKFCYSNPAMSIPPNRFVRPIWGGEPPPARIHVHYEAGAGDNICLVRYIGALLSRGYDVCYETEPELVDLVRRSYPTIEVICKSPDYPGSMNVPNFDYHIPIGMFPFLFETDIDTVPHHTPYLVPDPEKVAYYRSLLPRGGIGFCWSSGIRDGIWMERYGHNKSMQLEKMQPLLTAAWHKDVRCVSLQVGPERSELKGHEALIVDLLPEKPTWDDTAALIVALGKVVTVDTGVAHLAGALGVETHLAMHMQGSWHFMVANDEHPEWNTRSPWYPSMKVHRQIAMGAWEPVIYGIGRALFG